MILAILGGVLIGLAANLMLYFNGRITGISGILGGIIHPASSDRSWRLVFIAGLLAGGLILKVFIDPTLFIIETEVRTLDYAVAGILVGYGTLLGNGCTSGHGVCGISRFSVRSLVATALFIASGVISVALFRLARGGL